MKKRQVTLWVATLVLITISFLLGVHCVSEPEPPFVFAQLTPPPAGGAEAAAATEKPDEPDKPARTPAPTKPPVIVIANVAEILGKTRIIINVGQQEASLGIKKGLIGVIYADKSRSQQIGKAQIANVMPKFSYANVSETTQNISKSAVVVFTIPR